MRNDEYRIGAGFIIHYSAFITSSQLLPHRHELDPHAVRQLIPDPLAPFVPARGVEPHAGERRHQLKRTKAASPRLALARLKDGPAHAPSRPAGVDKERPNLRRLRRRVKLSRIAF